jgi:uncharacterized protein
LCCEREEPSFEKLDYPSRNPLGGVLCAGVIRAGVYGWNNRHDLTIKRDRALVYAAAEGDIAKMRLLFLLKADVNVRVELPFDGWPFANSPLTKAAANGQIEAVRFLLAKGASINQMDESGTALAHAAFRDHTGVMVLLMNEGADVNLGYNGWTNLTPLIAATRGRHIESVNLLLQRGAGKSKRAVSALWEAVGIGDVAISKRLLASGVDPHDENEDGTTLLAYAKEKGNPEIVRLIEQAEKASSAIVKSKNR